MRLIQRLLENDRETLKLLCGNPFRDSPPKLIRALFYHYRYTDWRERRQTGAWWTRHLIGVYLPPVSLDDLRRRFCARLSRLLSSQNGNGLRHLYCQKYLHGSLP